MVQVTNMLLSDGNKVLILKADPLKYYEGERLKSLNDRNGSLEMLIGSKLPKSGIILEYEVVAVENENGCSCICPDGSCDIYVGWLCGAGCR